MIGTIIFLLLAGLFLLKSQVRPPKAAAFGQSRPSYDLSPRSADNNWFNDEKFNHFKLDKGAAARPAAVKSEDKIEAQEQKLEEEAVKSPLSIEIPTAPGTPKTTAPKEAPKNDGPAGIEDIANMVKAMTGTKLPELPAKESFLLKSRPQDDYLENTKARPRSPFEIKAGSYLPAALITGINSDLPGAVTAQVTDSVYDTVTGNFVLIPQGARLIGVYNSDVSFGQKRVQVVWQRIIFPDGSSLDLENMQGVDVSGYTGLHDKVDNHYLRIYGNAVLLSLMGAGYAILNRKAEQSVDPRDAVAASVGQKLADVSGQVMQRNMDVAPTLIIDPGYKFKVMVMKDMVLEKIADAQGTLSYSK